MDFSAGSRFLALEKHQYCVYSHRRPYVLANQGSVTHPALTHVRAFSHASSLVPMQGFIQSESFWGGSSRKWVWLYILFYTTVPSFGGGGGEASPPHPPLWMKPCNGLNGHVRIIYRDAHHYLLGPYGSSFCVILLLSTLPAHLK